MKRNPLLYFSAKESITYSNELLCNCLHPTLMQSIPQDKQIHYKMQHKHLYVLLNQQGKKEETGCVSVPGVVLMQFCPY